MGSTSNGVLPASTQVLVAGGGPVGLAAAVELNRRGIDCVVIEPRAVVSRLRPRCNTVNVRTMEHLRRWGIADRLRERAPLPVAWSQAVVFCTSLTGYELSRFERVLGLVRDDDRFAELGQQAPNRRRSSCRRSNNGGDVTMLEAQDRVDLFVPHGFGEQLVDLGEIRMNYARAGDADRPALLLVPGQTESWWGYEPTMRLLAPHFEVFAVDLRGQGRSTQTPGRYTLDNMGNDLVRFVDVVIGRPTVVSGNSSGGVLAAWLAAYAKPGQIRGAICEDPPLFSSEVHPACGPSIRQSIGPLFALFNKWLGDQWTVGDWAGMQAATPRELPRPVLAALAQMGGRARPSTDRESTDPESSGPGGPPQNMKEYDPEWGRAFWSGAATASCDHERLLGAARAPILITHHFRTTDPATGTLMGAVSDQQVQRARQLVSGAGQRAELVDLPEMAHSMHGQDPELFTKTVLDWVATLNTP